MAGQTDWTTGPGKWFAVIALGVLCAAALAWSVVQSRAAYPPVAAVAPAPPNMEPPVVARASPTSSPTPSPKTEPPAAPTPAPAASTPSGAVDHLVRINAATVGELELLPGIGPALAKRIIDERTANGPFKSVDDLKRVRGIGAKILERLRDKVTAD